MRFLYSYKTSANEPKDGVIDAPSKDGVYALLKPQGIRPYNVRLAPGLGNKIKALGWMFFAFPLVVVIAVIGYIAYFNERIENANTEPPVVEDSVFTSPTRRQIIGDTAVIEAGIRNGWEDVFDDEGERFLASFAIPGVPAGVRATNVAELEKSLQRRVEFSPDDSMEAKQIKSMVEGMKDELRAYIAQGGTIKSYGERLVERQEQEQSYYRRIKEEIDAAARSGKPEEEIVSIWKSGNAELRNMGIKLVPMPEMGGE